MVTDFSIAKTSECQSKDDLILSLTAAPSVPFLLPPPSLGGYGITIFTNIFKRKSIEFIFNLKV